MQNRKYLSIDASFYHTRKRQNHFCSLVLVFFNTWVISSTWKKLEKRLEQPDSLYTVANVSNGACSLGIFDKSSDLLFYHKNVGQVSDTINCEKRV